MQAELLTIGSELTQGVTVNTNAAVLARRLAEVGVACLRQVTVGDDRRRVVEAIREALSRCDLLVTTGGLGPTFDDITMTAIAEAVHRPLTRQPAVADRIRRFYRQHHRAVQTAALRQADLPTGGTALPNVLGTAPGLWLSLPDGLLIALPGVPAELRAMLDRHVLPRLRRAERRQAIATRTLRTVGLVELDIERRLRRLRIPASVTVGVYPHLRAVDIRLTATAPSQRAAQRLLARVERPLRRMLGVTLYGTDEATLEQVVGELLVRQHRTLAVAESCTGGLVCDRLTDVPGSSRYLRGAVVAYHNDLKRGCLGVPARGLARFGAVSEQTAKAMAVGVQRFAGADVGLSITGIAGPSGGTAKKPVGLVYFGLADRRRVRSLRCRFVGDRAAVKRQAAQTALDWLRRCLLKSS